MDESTKRALAALSAKTMVELWPTTGRVLNLGKSATYRAAREGSIPAIRIGRQWRVPVAELRALLGLQREAA